MASQTLGVVGAGQMGNGIAQVAAYPGGVEVIRGLATSQDTYSRHGLVARLNSGLSHKA